MEITYLGHSSFLLKGKKAKVVTDPFDPEMVGFKFPRISADIVTVSHHHEDHNKIELVTDTKRVIEGPGEYEIGGVSLLGFKTYHDDKKGEERGKNTVYVIEIDELRIAHLGDLGHKLKESLVDALGEIDVLIIPVGGYYTLPPMDAVSVVQAIEPHIIIPMHYQIEGLKKETFEKLENAEPFIKELGFPIEKTDKLSVNKIDLEGESKVVVLERKS